MPIIRPNKGYLRKYSPLTPLPLTPLRVPMIHGAFGMIPDDCSPLKASSLEEPAVRTPKTLNPEP